MSLHRATPRIPTAQRQTMREGQRMFENMYKQDNRMYSSNIHQKKFVQRSVECVVDRKRVFQKGESRCVFVLSVCLGCR
jgi:hypothetical protein